MRKITDAYDKNDNAILKYAKETLLLDENPIKQTEVGKNSCVFGCIRRN
jgi:hypothetical protein